MKATLVIYTDKQGLKQVLADTRDALNPTHQHLSHELRRKLVNERWTWITTAGNCIRVSPMDTLQGRGVYVELDTRRHACHADNGVSAHLYALLEWSGVPFHRWHVKWLESKASAPWYLAGCARDFLEVPEPSGTSPNYRK